MKTTSVQPGRVLFGAFFLVAASMGGMARADPIFSVNSTLDQIDDNPGDGICHTATNTCTLRAAVMEANRVSAKTATIVLPAGTYTLTRPPTGPMDGSDDLGGDIDFVRTQLGFAAIALQGAGASTTTIDANQIDRVVEVGSSRSVAISGVTLRNGRADFFGGGILLNETGYLSITDCVVTANAIEGNGLGGGGGIWSAGTLDVLGSEVRGNSVGSYGGGLLVRAGVASLRQSTVANNSAVSGGGLLISTDASMSIEQSSITGNATGGSGGGISLSGGITMVNSTVAGNTAGDSGGGISIRLESNAPRNVYNSTIAFNAADENQDFSGSGGGIYVDAAEPAASFNIYNTIIASNYYHGTPQPDDCGGVVHTHAQNLFGDTSGCTIVQISGSWGYFSPLNSLGPPQYNGGPTPTVALLPGSNAIDAGNPTLGCLDNTSTTIAEDQRGFPRNVGICDLGAYEYGSIDPNNVIFQSGFDEN